MTVIATPPPVFTGEASLPRRRNRRVRQRISTLGASVILVAFTLMTLLPLYIMFTVSLSNGSEAVANPFAFPLNPHWENYVFSFQNMHYLRSVGNTLIITIATAVITILTSSMAAWAIVRYTRPWTRTAYQIFVAGLTIPIFVVLTPLYQVLQQMGLLDSYIGIVLAYSAITMPFVTIGPLEFCT